MHIKSIEIERKTCITLSTLKYVVLQDFFQQLLRFIYKYTVVEILYAMSLLP